MRKRCVLVGDIQVVTPYQIERLKGEYRYRRETGIGPQVKPG
ncbi:MAG: hypothetical protein QGF59_18785 [Pirellulaceae bacterium]|nr:hypothetical protein [Pirellulaceae bacterium]